jgi:hypothetical protein
MPLPLQLGLFPGRKGDAFKGMSNLAHERRITEVQRTGHGYWSGWPHGHPLQSELT